jgi:gamma-glutamyltranspeptidase
MYKGRWNNSRYGWEAVAVPGELYGLWLEYVNFGGKIPWNSLVQPTIELMEEGILICSLQYSYLQGRRESVKSNRKIFKIQKFP